MYGAQSLSTQGSVQTDREAFGTFAAPLLWARGIRDPKQLAGFIDPDAYQPTSPFAFGDEMNWAIARLLTACDEGESVAIWGDFDADGVTATAVLWEGLGQFFPQGDRLTYVIPNRLTESHGLSMAGLKSLAEQGCRLIITCDTGSTNLAELAYARELGLDVIVTDHHTLPDERPNVVALINPRSLEPDHPLSHLSGVAVAYKLVEALYETRPQLPAQPLEQVLDLVAIGLIADLVELKGDCRYLAQRGIERLQTQVKQPTRPGVAALLNYCRRSGDRPTDISFGIGPRINAISRIYGDAHFCVELLTSHDEPRCRKLAEDTELANLRRKALQRDMVDQVTRRLAELDLSTTQVIVLADSQWPVGVLGLVAGQIAQEYGRPTILLHVDEWTEPGTEEASNQPLARGSARSVNHIDLYELVQSQAHVLHSFGGHPYAAGLSLKADQIPLFAEAINQEFRSRYGSAIAQAPIIRTDLNVQVADLGQALFRELGLLEPCGMGNPIPRLLIQDCWFTNVWHRKLQDFQNRKLNYIKTTFLLWDESVSEGFPGMWWGHYKDEIPPGRCDVVIELDYNSSRQNGHTPSYEARLIAVRPSVSAAQSDGTRGDRLANLNPPGENSNSWLLDWRHRSSSDPSAISNHQSDAVSEAISDGGAAEAEAIPAVASCPASWQEFYDAIAQAQREQHKLAIAYPPPPNESPLEVWNRLVGIAKHLSRTEQSTTSTQLQTTLNVGDRTLQLGLGALSLLEFKITASAEHLWIRRSPTPSPSHLVNAASAVPDAVEAIAAIQTFIQAVGEEQFRQHYFHEAPWSTLKAIAEQFLKRSQDGHTL